MEAALQNPLQTVSASPSVSDRQWAASAHFLALLLALITAWMVGIAGIAGAGIIYLLKRDDSPFAAEHAREALNFNLSMLLYSLAAIGVAVLLAGVTLLTLGIGLIVTAPAGLLLILMAGGIAVMWLVCS
ncbi:MAG: DUF4870 domain-containing protein, partial [Pseudomonadota bacterium]|nr:DUF4870 domain-containing protein [Pseudomonadota bacterium]